MLWINLASLCYHSCTIMYPVIKNFSTWKPLLYRWYYEKRKNCEVWVFSNGPKVWICKQLMFTMSFFCLDKKLQNCFVVCKAFTGARTETRSCTTGRIHIVCVFSHNNDLKFYRHFKTDPNNVLTRMSSPQNGKNWIRRRKVFNYSWNIIILVLFSLMKIF